MPLCSYQKAFRQLIQAFIIFALFVSAYSIANNPIANADAIVQLDNARFTVLTPELIRLEFSASKNFEDKASLTMINRQLNTPEFYKKIAGNTLTIDTDNLHLTYINDGNSFSEKNLNVKILSNKKVISHWQPNLTDDKNLKGTLRTLDQADGWNYESALENGVISRNGWSLIDDSQNNLFDGSTDWNWVTPRTNKNIDWYLFGYGNNYKKAIYDFTQIAGKIPMPPKYAFGYWWSRYWVYNDNELRELVKQFRDFKIPMDVLIIDMDWHETYGFNGTHIETDSQGQMKGWTGYTWNKNLFPQPEKFIQWTNEQHLKTSLNLHPASGIAPMEEKYDEFAKAYGVKAYDAKASDAKASDAKDRREYIPYNMSDKKWANTYFDTMLKPMQDWGIDFWWLDWQQFLQDKQIPSLSVTWWLNYTFFTNMEKTGKRPMIFHRWGGLGNHRYPIGFSGDAKTNWETLDFETYFTATAANVGYGYWSHDIGGHVSNGMPTDGELYLRWIQFGALSPILRTHSSKISLIERRPWMFPHEFSAMRDAIRFRYTLAPYIYTAAHNTYETGVALVHPLYYDYADSPQAYTYKNEYFFGNDIIAAPITTPVDKVTHLADKKIWLPKGDWFEYSSGTLLKGDREITRRYALNEIPLFVKAGSVIPMNPEVENLQQRPSKQILTIIPGGKSGETQLYNDDESTSDYQKNKFTTRKVTNTEINSKTLKIVIEPIKGSYAEMQTEQTFDIKLLNRTLPAHTKINDTGNTNVQVEYLNTEFASVIHLPAISTNQRIKLTIEFSQSFNEQNNAFNGNKGFMQRVASATETLKYASALTDWAGALPNEVYSVGNIVNELQYEPENAFDDMLKLNQQKKSLRNVLLAIPNVSQETTKPLVEFLEL